MITYRERLRSHLVKSNFRVLGVLAEQPHIPPPLERMKPLLRSRDESLKQRYRELRDKYLPVE